MRSPGGRRRSCGFMSGSRSSCRVVKLSSCRVVEGRDADVTRQLDNSTTRELDNSTTRELDNSTTRQLDNSTRQLSLIAIGHLPAEAIAPLLDHFERIEVLQLDIPPRDDVAKHRAEFNRTVDAAEN